MVQMGCDIRQSQADHWSCSSKWQSSAGDDSSWKKVSDWEGSQWSAPTRRTLKGSEHESDRDWQLQQMRYGEGWACDSTQSHSKRAKPTYTDPEDDRMTDSSLPFGSTSRAYDPEKDGSFWQRFDRPELVVFLFFCNAACVQTQLALFLTLKSKPRRDRSCPHASEWWG